MTRSDQNALRRLAGMTTDGAATTDDLQGLLLQVVLALLMIFMIAYFIFVQSQKRERDEEVMDLNRQKLTLALDKVAEDHRVRYGLNAMMTQGTDGKRTFEPDDHVRGGHIELSPAAKAAFGQGSRAAAEDYADLQKTTEAWRGAILAEAELSYDALGDDLAGWFETALAREIESVRLDTRGVQRALAARLQRVWLENPDEISKTDDPLAFAELLKTKSLEAVKAETGAEILK